MAPTAPPISPLGTNVARPDVGLRIQLDHGLPKALGLPLPNSSPKKVRGAGLGLRAHLKGMGIVSHVDPESSKLSLTIN